MSVVTFSHKGDFKKTEKFFAKIEHAVLGTSIFDKYGQMGVEALREATPKDSGETANSWHYKIQNNKNSATIYWFNTHTNKGVNIAIILQYGHGTRNGGYVKGIDYINPAIKPIFEKMAEDAWKEIENA